ncbi:MAG: V-type ATP synthase subunit E [Oscillospiraceae bacterium]|nr:V-type ATP synthase subunit E [Oscillospiraceae bacterium]
MNGIENITARILTDAERDAKTIRDRSAVTCQRVTEKYTKEAEDAYWKLVSAGKQEATQLSERIAGTAAMEAKKQILTFKQNMVEQTFQAVTDKLVNLPEDEYVAFLTGLICRAARTGEEQLIFSPKDRGQFGKKATMAANEALAKAGKTAQLTMSETTREMLGGVIVTDGKIDMNCSIEALVEEARGPLTNQVASILFE